MNRNRVFNSRSHSPSAAHLHCRWPIKRPNNHTWPLQKRQGHRSVKEKFAKLLILQLNSSLRGSKATSILIWDGGEGVRERGAFNLPTGEKDGKRHLLNWIFVAEYRIVLPLRPYLRLLPAVTGVPREHDFPQRFPRPWTCHNIPRLSITV